MIWNRSRKLNLQYGGFSKQQVVQEIEQCQRHVQSTSTIAEQQLHGQPRSSSEGLH